MRKIILGLVATAAIAAPLALSAPADAATTGTGAMHFVTHYQGQDYVHDGITTYTCDAAGNVNFAFTGADPAWTGNGYGTITATLVTIHGARPTDGYTYDITGNITGPGTWELTASTDSLGQVGASAEGRSPTSRTAPLTRSCPPATTASTCPAPPRPASRASRSLRSPRT